MINHPAEELKPILEAGLTVIGDTQRQRYDYVAVHRVELVEEINEKMRALIDKAAPLAQQLGLIPDPVALAKTGTKSALDAYRKYLTLDEPFTALLKAWQYIWLAATGPASAVGRGKKWNESIRSWPGGLAAWEDPLAVTNIDVRDALDADHRALAAIAHHDHEGHYLLLDGPRLEKRLTETPFERAPVRAGGPHPRVWLPKAKLHPMYRVVPNAGEADQSSRNRFV